MPTLWQSWKRSLSCNKDSSLSCKKKDVQTPTAVPKARSRTTSTTRRRIHNDDGAPEHRKSGCSKSLANLKGVINTTNSTTISIASFSSSSTATTTTTTDGEKRQLHSGRSKPSLHQEKEKEKEKEKKAATAPFQYNSNNPRSSTTNFRRTLGSMRCYDCSLVQNPAAMPFVLQRGCIPSQPPVTVSCRRCGEIFPTHHALHRHHFANHAMRELSAGDSSRNVVEIIFRTSWLQQQHYCNLNIERVLKVNNLGRTITKFEEYRDFVKAKAGRLPPGKKHPRCLADGNELLRFYATAITCSLVAGLCTSPNCHLCAIIRSGFSAAGHMGTTQEAPREDGVTGIRTYATSGKAHEKAQVQSKGPYRRAMLLCRVVAGRVFKANDNTNGAISTTTAMDTNCNMEEEEEGECKSSLPSSTPPPPAAYDSVGAKPGPCSNIIEDLRVFNPAAILPCFVVLYTC